MENLPESDVVSPKKKNIVVGRTEGDIILYTTSNLKKIDETSLFDVNCFGKKRIWVHQEYTQSVLLGGKFHQIYKRKGVGKNKNYTYIYSACLIEVNLSELPRRNSP